MNLPAFSGTLLSLPWACLVPLQETLESGPSFLPQACFRLILVDHHAGQCGNDLGYEYLYLQGRLPVISVMPMEGQQFSASDTKVLFRAGRKEEEAARSHCTPV